MHAGRIEHHYAPSSVGALMDPAFLRNAVSDADGTRREETMSMMPGWLKAKSRIRRWLELALRRPVAR